MTYNILLVDDDLNHIKTVEQIIQQRMHYNATVVQNGKEAINKLTSGNHNNIDLVLLDLSMPEVDGIDVLNAVKPINPNLPIIIRTGYDDIDLAIKAMKAGATDYIKKLDSPEKLQQSIDNALRKHVLNEELTKLKQENNRDVTFANIIGESKAIKEMISLGQKVSDSNIPVLIEGESGCGKELMARAIHNDSKRSHMPFIAVNCGAIPENLVESILFGHEKGAFTGAEFKTSGKFREANGGTLFLDEVGELPLDVQVKLLRVLQDGEIDPVGSSKPIKVDVRLISATNRDLAKEVKESRFREDLYYRLNVFPIYVPALRHRNGDIELLIKDFFHIFNKTENKHITTIDDEALKMLCSYNWPGNIRQLKNTIFRAVVLCEGNALKMNDFPQIVQNIQSGDNVQNNTFNKFDNILALEKDGHFRKLNDLEKDVIQSALEHYNGHMSEVARRLGIGRSTLYRKLSDYGISIEKSTLDEGNENA